MTGYATATADRPYGTLELELRAVNHRYLDIQFRIADELKSFESAFRELISKKLTRGKIECRMGWSANARVALNLDLDRLRDLVGLAKVVHREYDQIAPLTVADVLQWPGVIATAPSDANSVRDDSLALMHQCLDELTETRAREGEKLASMLFERATEIESILKQLAPQLPRLVASYHDKLATRLKQAQVDGDDDRLRQEFALFAQKADVDEEISRLHAHLGELRRILGSGGAVGKRLDFLMQEFNREANTLGSKSIASEMSQAAMDIKVLTEQMREQIQNIE